MAQNICNYHTNNVTPTPFCPEAIAGKGFDIENNVIPLSNKAVELSKNQESGFANPEYSGKPAPVITQTITLLITSS